MAHTGPENTDDLVRVLLDKDKIDQRVKELAKQINRDYKNIKEPLILVGILKGSFIFLSDLVRELTIPHIVEFIAISSYGKSGDQQGTVRMLMDTREDLQGHNILIVEDILDSGNTLSYLIKNIKARGVKSVKTAVFLDKPDRHIVPVEISYIGFEIPDVWVVGYGLDYKEKYRTLPYIAEMKPQP